LAEAEADAPIFLVGFMGSGKSTVGRIVATRLGWTFADLDRVIAEQAGATIAEIFAREGEEAFRHRETEAIRGATALRRTVVATGGGAACREPNLSLILSAGPVVALSVTPEEAVRRTRGPGGRPLLPGGASGPDRLRAAEALLRDREPFYARAHARVETEGRSPETVAGDVLRVIEALAR
jgi:shikimate kinase